MFAEQAGAIADTKPRTAAGKVLWHFTMSLDGFVAGPNHAMDWMTGVSRPGRHFGQMLRLLVAVEPARRVEVETLAKLPRAFAGLVRQRRQQFGLRTGRGGGQTKVGKGSGHARDEQCRRLRPSQPVQARPPSVEQPDAAPTTRFGVERKPRGLQCGHIAQDRALGHLQDRGELRGGGAAPGLQREQQRDQPVGLHSDTLWRCLLRCYQDEIIALVRPAGAAGNAMIFRPLFRLIR
jgi:hypothetical protein